MIQTNATLITEQMAKFFKKNNFIVSVSIDGARKTHDENRLKYSGKGSFDDAMKGVEILRKNGIFPPVIATVTKDSLDYAVENFNFLIENGFKEIKYSPVYDSDSDDFSISSDDWYGYLKKILYRWLELKDESIKVREIDEILAWFAGNNFALCSNQGTCARWISIDEEGNVYPCEYMRGTNMYGNIGIDRLSDILKSNQYYLFSKQINYYPPECLQCKLFNICHNGCPATRIDKNRELTFKGRYVYCEERKKLYKEIEKILKG